MTKLAKSKVDSGSQSRPISVDLLIIVFGLITAVGLTGSYLFLDIRFALSLTILILAWWVDIILKREFFGGLGPTFLADLSLAAFSFALSYVFALAALDPIVTMLKDITPSDLPQIEVLLSGNVYSLTYATGFTAIVGFVWLLNLVLSRTLASPQLKTHPRLRVGVWVLAGSLTVIALILALHPQLVNLS